MIYGENILWYVSERYSSSLFDFLLFVAIFGGEFFFCFVLFFVELFFQNTFQAF